MTGSSGTSGTMIPPVQGEVDPMAPDTELPPVPRLVNVRATARGDSVSISFDPIEGAPDYRVYELPTDDRITVGDDGQVAIADAVYRCAGNRQAPPANMDDGPMLQSGAIFTFVEKQGVFGFDRNLDNATLGYVYAEPGDGRIPVYALGSPDPEDDVSCYFMRWNETRIKRYVTSEDERDSLLASGWRNHGIAFYAPESTDGTRPVYMSDIAANPSFAWIDGPEAELRENGSERFRALTDAATDAVPLMRVFYSNVCGRSHDEVVVGRARFERARRQGDQLPMFELQWSGLSGRTTLVVEALDQGCPGLGGMLAPESRPAGLTAFDKTYHRWITPEEAQAADPDGALFINGQHDVANRPRAIARSFITIEPGAEPDLDWFMGFGPDDTLGTFTDLECGALSGNCFQEFRMRSEVADLGFFAVESERFGFRSMFGQWWLTYADWAADTNGKVRLTPLQKGEVSADSFLYATMEVDAFTSHRRYPQLLISDQEPPVQHNLVNGNTVLVQTFGLWPPVYEVQICDHRTWDVNNQCPRADLYHVRNPNDPTEITALAPNAEVGEHTGVDRSTFFEAYVSTSRIFLFLDGEPYGCADLPAAGVPQGEVTVTFGDVLYHSDADELEWDGYMRQNVHFETRRHFDNLGFKSRVPAPAWDYTRFPCTSRFVAE
jgi:hypothetical protein